MTDSDVRASFRQQAIWCDQLGSPFTARLLGVAAERLDVATSAGRRVLGWTGRPEAQFGALALRFAGGLHGLVRAKCLPDLARIYPPAPLPDPDALWAAVEAALREHGDAIDPWLDSAPQTNEVARSAALMAGLRVLADAVDQPVELFEVGSSAGLNLLPDRYRTVLGGTATGPADSPVHIEPAWTGPTPPMAEPVVAGRRGVDLRPLNPADPRDRARLLAYIWPDQAERLARAEAAMSIAAADPAPVDQGEAAAWVERHVRPRPGVTPVLMHSIAHQYFPVETQTRIAAHMGNLAIAWLRYEVDTARGGLPELRLRLPGGEERLLGRGSAHLTHLTWLGAGDRPR